MTEDQQLIDSARKNIRKRIRKRANEKLDTGHNGQYHDLQMPKPPTKQLTDQLREAIDASGVTRYQIAAETGINESALAKSYNGRRGLSM